MARRTPRDWGRLPAETRKQRGLSQKHIAATLGVSTFRVSQIEHGRVTSSEVIARYIEALGTADACIGQIPQRRLRSQNAEHGVPPSEPVPSREITERSRRSRARMFRAFCELDYGRFSSGTAFHHGDLDLSGDWATVAPDGARHPGRSGQPTRRIHRAQEAVRRSAARPRCSRRPQ
jgi:transcriptional regulator with XRE-family HTH domain